MKTGFIIFAHCNGHTKEDVDDIIENISVFHPECEFFINHPTISHEKIFTTHNLGPLNKSSFIFGAFVDIINKLSIEDIHKCDNFCLVSANQYFIDNIKAEKNINYVQFYNTDDWTNRYNGKDFSTNIIGTPLRQPYGVWDQKCFYKKIGISNPMASNWEGAILTKESMILCKQYINVAIQEYPNSDLISLFPGYMALKSGQEWKFPSFFGTFDPSNRPIFNHIITIDQLINKKREGYSTIKRVNYEKNCPIKDYIRKNYYKKEI